MNKQETFNKLFSQSKEKLFGIAYAVVKNQQSAEDVLQDAYIKAWNKFEDFDFSKKFENWMTSIVRNTAIDFTRSKQHQFQPISIEGTLKHVHTENSMTLEIPDHNTDTISNYESKELRDEIYQIINSMPSELKDVMIAYDLGETFSDMAKRMQVPIHTVRTRFDRAKNIVKKQMEENQNIAF